MSDTSRAPPQSVEAEESVIGGILVHSKQLLDVAPIVSAEDFYHPALRAIYEAMLELDTASKPIDCLTVVEQMRSLETFDRLRSLGGADHLTELAGKHMVGNIVFHARIVRDKAARRSWLETINNLQRAGYSDMSDADFRKQTEQDLLALTVGKASGEPETKPIKAFMHQFLDELNTRVKNRQAGNGGLVGITTGYERLDGMTSGLRDDDLILIAGRPSMGKSAFVMNLVERSARSGVAWLVFSLEMGGLSLVQRMVSGAASVDGHRLAQGEVETGQWGRISTATSQLAGLPIEICDRNDLSIGHVRSLARRHRLTVAAKHPKFAVAVDYLQLVETAKRRGGDNREREVSEISRGLKALARELHCPVVALSQLNRSLESRADKRPMMSDLRESGALEQDADVIAFIYRDEVYSGDNVKDEDKGIAEIIIGKQRNGSLGTVRLAFKNAFTRFDNLSNRDDSTAPSGHWQDRGEP